MSTDEPFEGMDWQFAETDTGATCGLRIGDVLEIQWFREGVMLKDVRRGHKLFIGNAEGWMTVFDAMLAVAGEKDADFLAEGAPEQLAEALREA